MATSYEKIYENLLPKFRSYEIPLMTEDEVKAELHDYLVPAIAMFSGCKKLRNRDEELEQFNDNLSEIEIDILCNFMVIKYVDSAHILTPSILKASLSSSDFNAFSPANHLDKLLQMQKHYRWENDTMVSQYGWKVKDEKKSFDDLKKLVKINREEIL